MELHRKTESIRFRRQPSDAEHQSDSREMMLLVRIQVVVWVGDVERQSLRESERVWWVCVLRCIYILSKRELSIESFEREIVSRE